MSSIKKLKPTRANKQLTLDTIVQDSKKYEKKTKVTLKDGRFTYIFNHFSNVQIDEMLKSFGMFIAEYTQKIGAISEEKMQDYLNMHILIYFSQLTDRLDYSFDEKLIVIDKSLENDMAEEIFSHFNKDELGKVHVRMFKKLEAYQELAKNNIEIQNKLREHVLNSNMDNKEEILNVLLSQNAHINSNAEMGETVVENI